jgi:uncharacterized repeat protein (TIGR03847 family)
MPRLVFEHPEPDRFIAGTVGEPGQRTFFLQARSGTRVTTVALEKGQVSVLAERVDELLDEVVRRSAGAAPVPAVAPATARDNAPLDAPIDEEFRVGTMSLAWDGDEERVVIECYAGDDSDDGDNDLEDEDPEATGSVLRISLAPGQARAFAKRALAVVAAGRPPCPFCGNPLDPEGHVCPRANGFRR